MKKRTFLSVLLVATLMVSAQASLSLSEGQSALVYALPKTELCIAVEVEKEMQNPGVFYQYSERYLATNKIITEQKTVYKLKNISVKTRAVADPARTYSYIPTANSPFNHISVNAEGLLCGVNVPYVAPAAASKPTDQKAKLITPEKGLLPLGEEYMLAGSNAKLAEGAAKQIYRIRESRISLLTADLEHLPADGASFTAMLKGLDKMENELTELFVGKTTTETITQTIYLTPGTALTNQILFRLSALKGIVATDDLSGAPYYINVVPAVAPLTPADPKAKKEKVGVNYILPAPTQVSIGDGTNTFFSKQFNMPQFGTVIPIYESLLKQQNVKIRIDENTGRLLSIE